MFILKKRAPFGVVVWGLLKTFFLKIPKFVWIGYLSRTMFEGGRKNKPSNSPSFSHFLTSSSQLIPINPFVNFHLKQDRFGKTRKFTLCLSALVANY